MYITRFLSGPWRTPQSTSTLSATFIAVIMPAGHGVQIAHFPGHRMLIIFDTNIINKTHRKVLIFSLEWPIVGLENN